MSCRSTSGVLSLDHLGGCSESRQLPGIRSILTVLLLCTMSASAVAGFTPGELRWAATVVAAGSADRPPVGAGWTGGSGRRDPLAAFFALTPTHIHIRGPRSAG